LVEKERKNKPPRQKWIANDTFDLYFTIENVTLALNPNNAYEYDL